MKIIELNVVKFFSSVLLLIAGRKPKTEGGQLVPYTPKEACEAIDIIAKHHDPSNDIEDLI